MNVQTIRCKLFQCGDLVYWKRFNSNETVDHFFRKRKPRNYWVNIKHQRSLFQRIYTKFGLKSWEEWYRITVLDIKNNGGGPLMDLYGNSHIQALKSIYPEYPWRTWRFLQVPKGFWENEGNIKDVIESLSKDLNITNLDDWYNITMAQMRALGCATILSKYKLKDLLAKVYPDHKWDFNQIQSHKKEQTHLFRNIKALFPDLDIHTEVPFENLKYSTTNYSMQLDIFIPSLRVAFEYQGGQHYFSTDIFGDNSEQRMKDEEKKVSCQKQNITLIEIPYWWDGSKKSLQATIHKYRPDIIQNSEGASPIPEVSPFSEYQRKSTNMEYNENEYFLTTGSSFGVVPKCLGCKREFTNRNELRIQTYGKFQKGSVVGKVTFCLNPDCLENGNANAKAKRYKVPLFDGKVKFSSSITKEPPVVSGIEWIKELEE